MAQFTGGFGKPGYLPEIATELGFVRVAREGVPMSYMGYYFLPDAVESLNNHEKDTKNRRAEREARETKVEEDAAREAALSGDIGLILALSPAQFGYAMAVVLRMLGMKNIQRVGGRGHLSVVITAHDASERTVLVQCKRRASTKKIGSPEIEKFIGMAHLHHHSDLKLFVTTSEYTNRARTLAPLHDVQLMSGSDIENLAQKQRQSSS
jgi:restriction endonuclease Mrr